MKNKRLKEVHQTNKRLNIFKPEDCLNFIKENRIKLFLKDPFLSGDLLQESKGNDNDFRERHRI